MAEKDQGAKAIIQLRPADMITFALPDAEYLGPLATDVATEPQLVLDTLHRIRYHGVECAANIELQAALDTAMRRVKSQAPAEQIEPLAFIMAVFTAQVNHDADLARAIIRRVFMSFDIFKDSPFYQEIIQEAAQEAAEKAREAAREAAEKAAREAAINAMRELARAGLEGRFGPLAEDIQQALNTADEATLKTVLSSDTLAQVRERLGLKPQG